MKGIRRGWTEAGLALLMVATACGPAERQAPPELVAHYASFEMVAGRPQRVLVGLESSGADLVAFGTVRFSFSYLGRHSHRPGSAVRWWPTSAHPRPAPRPRLAGAPGGGSLGAFGVYGTDGVRFDEAGFWPVMVTAEIGGEERRAEAPVASPGVVYDDHHINPGVDVLHGGF